MECCVQQRVYVCRLNSIDELKQRLIIDVWYSLQQSVRPIDGESACERACMQMENIFNIYCHLVKRVK